MKVKIKSSENIASGIKWWYSSRVGEEFEVTQDPEREEYYYTETEFMGEMQQLHILKADCEAVTA